MSPDAEALLAWLAARGGTARQRDLGDMAPRAFRKASIYGPLVEELLARGAIVETCTRPRTFEVVKASAPKSSSGSKLPAMLAEAVADCADLPAALAAYWGAVTVRDRIVSRLLASKGLPTDGEYVRAAHAVDRAVAQAFGCELQG